MPKVELKEFLEGQAKIPEVLAQMGYIVRSWCSNIGGYRDNKHGGTVHIAAAQLTSLL